LEDRVNPKPREIFRMVFCGVREPGLVGAICSRTLCPNGIVSECIFLGRSADGHRLTNEELDRWIATFPIEKPDGIIRPVRLPDCTVPIPDGEVRRA